MTHSSQAEQMMRRVSPEGRERARRERLRRQRVMRRLVVRCGVAVVGVLLAALAYGGLVAPLGPLGLLVVAVAMVAACVVTAAMMRERPLASATIADADLPQLPDRTARWLEQQRAALPAPAATLLDGIGVRLDALAPELGRLDPAEPAADEVRRLVGRELPGLVERYRAVPATLRADARDGGDSADAHLSSGLRLIDGELARMTERLASGAFDGLSTQDRFLQLKYRGDGVLGGE